MNRTLDNHDAGDGSGLGVHLFADREAPVVVSTGYGERGNHVERGIAETTLHHFKSNRESRDRWKVLVVVENELTEVSDDVPQGHCLVSAAPEALIRPVPRQRHENVFLNVG